VSADAIPEEGAVGGVAETREEYIPEWTDPRMEEHADSMDEVRRRRLERFHSESARTDTNTDSQNGDAGS